MALSGIRKDSRRWVAMVDRDGDPVCAWCGTSDDVIVDHILSRSRGGTNDLENLQFLCIGCNSTKGSRTNEECSKTIVHSSAAAQAGFTIIPNVVLLDRRLSLGARMLYGVLKSYAWHHDAVWPGQERVADELGISVRSLREYGRELVDVGLVTIRRRGRGMTNVYSINDPKLRGADFADQGHVPGSRPAKLAALDRQKTTPEVDEVEEDSVGAKAPTANGSVSTEKTSFDLLWDACDELVQKAPTPKSARAAYAKVIREMFDAGWTADLVRERAKAYRKSALSREWPLTLAALAKWGEHVEIPNGSRPVSFDAVYEPFTNTLPSDENARRMRELAASLSGAVKEMPEGDA